MPLPTTRQPVGSVVVDHSDGSLGRHRLAVVTDHPGAYPELVLIAGEDDLREGRRSLRYPSSLLDPSPSDRWDADVLQALAAVAPAPHPQH